jgi:hypothetical protein
VKQTLIATALSAVHIAMIGGLIASAMGTPAFAQGQNREPVEKTSKAVACPSGWSTTKNNETDTSRCFPQGSISPKIYAKTEKETCESGYYEVYRLWCSTKRP